MEIIFFNDIFNLDKYYFKAFKKKLARFYNHENKKRMIKIKNNYSDPAHK